MLRLLSWGSTVGGEKAVELDWKLYAARQHSSPSRKSPPVTSLKRKRSDNDAFQTSPSSYKKRLATTNGPVPVKTESTTSSLLSLPPLEPQIQRASPAPTILTDTMPKMEANEEVVVDDLSSTTTRLSESQLRSLRKTVDLQIGLEILLKHKEMRLIDQELAKCQVALEQLRRCSEIPYLGTRLSEDVSNGVGPSVRRPGLRSLPESPAPWGVTDGPYTRHYAMWLLPDSRFDGGETEVVNLLAASKTPTNGRPSRGSFLDPIESSGRARKQNAGKTSATRNGQVPPHDKNGPLVLKRKSDGVMVKLVCVDCGRQNFGSAQGFINHCRIAHVRSFASHDAAAEICGEAVELDEFGAVIGHEPAATPTKSMVHPLIRSARTLQQPQTPSAVNATMDGTNSDVEMVNSTSGKPNRKEKKKCAPKASPDFLPSLFTPHLSALVQNKGLGLNLQDLVADAKTKVELFETESEDEDMDVDTPVMDIVRRRHPQVAGNKHPARSTMSPLPSPTLSRVPMASTQPPKPGPLATNLPSPPSSSPHDPTFGNHGYMAHGSTVEPSPTTSVDSYQAPSLVDDDGDEAHSPSNSITFGDEAGSVDFEVEDDDQASQSAGPASALRRNYDDQPKISEEPDVGRPSAIRRSLGSREVKHVSFVSPSPSRDMAKRKDVDGIGERESRMH